ncbi:hypothetical protein Xbed_01916 [Xenorhabdus beddingii]|uniref:Uncharacterized protein n=1 Tax=Xenorhabdus beddingii TaxID=40578 RepID=A0A1Y2SMF4_9GAMM|nr:hypothetical protein Xbed_01916 [Xenorhabdus beddingii]
MTGGELIEFIRWLIKRSRVTAGYPVFGLLLFQTEVCLHGAGLDAG